MPTDMYADSNAVRELSMILGQKLPLVRLKLGPDLDADKAVLSNQSFRRAITTTYTFQRQICVEGCTDLTKEVFPLIESCVHLRDLNLTATVISDLSFLRGCKVLANLKLSRTPLETCAGVEHCKLLRTIDLRHTAVSDLSPLAQCGQLRCLDVGGTPVADLQAVASCRQLTTVYLDGTQVSNIDCLASCPKLELVNIGFTKVDKKLISPAIKSEVVVSKPRSLAWFEAVFKNKTEDLPDILRQAQWIDERANPFLRTMCMACFDKQCRRKTPFFRFTLESLRPTALHIAVLLGQEVMIHFLMRQGAEIHLKCWFGNVVDEGGKGREVTPGQLADLCGEQAYWGTIRDHYKRGLNTRKVSLDKAQRIRRLLMRDEALTQEAARLADADS